MGLGFGIVGTGMIAEYHARAIADVRGAVLVGCTDLRAEAAERFARDLNCSAFATLAGMLADPRIDVVTICTPSGAHMEPAVQAAQARKHVIVEKPLEITLNRCDRIIEACRKNRVVLSTVFPSRFHESAVLLKKAIEQQRFGRVTSADAYVKWFRTQDYYDSGAWRGTWKLDGGGALMNQAIHSVDLLAWLMGPVTSVTAHVATLAHQRIAVEDVAVATLEFASGALGVIEASTAAYPGYLKRIEIHGSHGSAVMEEEDIRVWDFAKMKPADQKLLQRMSDRTHTGGGASDPRAIGHHGHTAQFRDVVKAIRAEQPPAIDGVEGRRSVEIILAIYKAAESGKAVTLPLASDPKLKARERG